MHQISVDIICPKCSGKALFKTDLIGTYKLYPDVHGFVSCKNCGSNGEHTFSNQDYYYQIDVDGRKLFARNLDNLILLRDFFSGGYKTKPNQDPEFDFPREFYQKKDVIVKRINQLLERGQG